MECTDLRSSTRLLVALLIACLLLSPQTVSAAPDKDATIAAARKEGTVVVHGPPGKLYEDALTRGFEQSNPGIHVEFSGANNRTAVPKLFREREAKLYLWDVWLGGPATILSQLKPRGVLSPLPPVLFAENTDDKLWVHGFADGWQDKEKQFVYAFDAGIQDTAIINWNFVKHDDVKTVADLVKPQFAGKILIDEPRRGGSGNGSSMGILVNYGEDLLRKLYANKVSVNENRRQAAEWLVRGRYPIVLGTGMNELEIFREQGLVKNISPITPGPNEKVQMTPGFGSVSLVDHPQHPNAATVYINWLLSQDGQTKWVTTQRTSRRLDVPCDDTCQNNKQVLAKAGDKYFKGQDEDAVPIRERAVAIANEVINAPAPKGDAD
jgi:iron(III) transport system substrate-binding protein